MTAEDKRAEIDRRFDETFAVFDERMRKEQETVSQERAGRAGTPAQATVPPGEKARVLQPAVRARVQRRRRRRRRAG